MGALKKGRLHCGTMNFSIPTIKSGDTWKAKTWNGLTSFYGNYIWTDGTNIYYSSSNEQYVLNGDTWEAKTWNGLTSFFGDYIWTDGTNIYYSNDENQYVLNGDTWEPKTWNGLTSFFTSYIWTDGLNIYYSSYGSLSGEVFMYVLNGDTWEPKTWDAAPFLDGRDVWSDGINIDYSSRTVHYALNGDTWKPKDWGDKSLLIVGSGIWSDGTDIYLSFDLPGSQLVLNENGFEEKTWKGLTPTEADRIWTDGTNIYYSKGANQYVLTTADPVPVSTLDPQSLMVGWLVGKKIKILRLNKQK